MRGNVVGTFIYFWAFMLGVVIFGRIFGFMDDSKTTIMILVGAAIVFVVWSVARSLAAKKRAEKEWQEKHSKPAKGKKTR